MPSLIERDLGKINLTAEKQQEIARWSGGLLIVAATVFGMSREGTICAGLGSIVLLAYLACVTGEIKTENSHNPSLEEDL